MDITCCTYIGALYTFYCFDFDAGKCQSVIFFEVMLAVIMMTTMLWKGLLLLLAMARVVAGLQLAQPALHAWQRSVAGAGAYVAATVVTSPIDVIKTRAQAPGKESRNAFAVALEMLRREGASSFFCGLTPALMMAPAAMVQVRVHVVP